MCFSLSCLTISNIMECSTPNTDMIMTGSLIFTYCDNSSFFILKFFYLFKSLWLHQVAYRSLVSWPEMEPTSLALEAWSLNHWTTREVPIWKILKAVQFLFLLCCQSIRKSHWLSLQNTSRKVLLLSLSSITMFGSAPYHLSFGLLPPPPT